MGWFDGFPFMSKEERDRRRKDFEKRVVPFGAEAQREKLKETLKELFPKVDNMDAVFAFFDAKDAYTRKDTPEEGYAAARQRLRKQRWVNGRTETIMLRFIEMELLITSLDEFPTAAQVMEGLFEE